MKHEGLSTHRLRSNPMEAAYAKAWIKEAPGTLPYLLHGQDRHDGLTQEEATIAATIIQWLGSPVGQCFVDGVRAQFARRKD